MLNRRHVFWAASALFPGAASLPAAAQASWPANPIRFLVGFPPGGNIDYLARIVGKELGTRLGQTVVIENISGASGNLATQAMVRAAADGYTIGFAAIPMSTNPALMKNIGYDANKDVAMVCQMSSVPVIVVAGAHTPYKSIADIVQASKAKPGQLSFGHGGHGTSGFLAAALFAREAGVKFLHVPYKGTGPILTDLLGGQIDGTFAVADTNLPALVGQGKIRALAVMQDTRVPTLPDVPTLRELGYPASTDFRSWHGVMVRAGTPPALIDRLHAEISAVIGMASVREAMAKAALEPRLSATPAAFDSFYRSEMARWQDLVKHTGLTPE
jgi:tripartite-type tricarboxylate transporter receptor subunit TctC